MSSTTHLRSSPSCRIRIEHRRRWWIHCQRDSSDGDVKKVDDFNWCELMRIRSAKNSGEFTMETGRVFWRGRIPQNVE
ncbi:hypothetical protein GCK72_022318 [Caenorhabditis remanei]|uniref:Uncharacterized protein n=1 Tax=Caenorhabditis remanei TaxID=31234 RepID=A0A2P4WS43_CAERE|nr:hypothetical protein GCK72_022318 [Caenorhabditis remanei]KAF1745871.1 hypothetical protein GCK72_022318 [Caenorhabditis remanei]